MPGFNGRGPEGTGPMTGGGRGFCNSAGRTFSGRGLPFRTGKGRGFGNNRYPRMRSRAGLGNTGFPYFGREQEENSLRSQASMLKDELKAVERRLKELEDTEKNDI